MLWTWWSKLKVSEYFNKQFNNQYNTISHKSHLVINSSVLGSHAFSRQFRCYHIVAETNGRHFPVDIFRCIFLNESVWISIKMSLKFVPKGPLNNIPSLFQVIAWRRSGDKPLSEPTMVSVLTHICVTRLQWVKASDVLHIAAVKWGKIPVAQTFLTVFWKLDSFRGIWNNLCYDNTNIIKFGTSAYLLGCQWLHILTMLSNIMFSGQILTRNILNRFPHLSQSFRTLLSMLN